MATNDQLNVIFDIIGTPNEEDVSFVTDVKAQEYLKTFHTRPRANLKDIYPGIAEEGFDLLQKMLQFNPYLRLSVDECLEHPYLTVARIPSREAECEQQIYLEIEKEGELKTERLRELFLQEIEYFREHSEFRNRENQENKKLEVSNWYFWFFTEREPNNKVIR